MRGPMLGHKMVETLQNSDILDMLPIMYHQLHDSFPWDRDINNITGKHPLPGKRRIDHLPINRS